ncbi:ankyrin repeat domain-containing protein [Halomonadaceae bacterium KBTZ08]
MKGIIASVIVLLLVAVIGLGGWSLHTADIQDVSLCVTEDDTHYIPNSVCEQYMFQFRGTPSDIEYLENGAGIAFFFGIEDQEMRRRVMSFFLENGLSINKPSAIDGLPPLHAAVLMNDPQLVEFLLEHGADPTQKDQKHDLTASRYLELLKQKNPERDWSEVAGQLESQG